MCIKGYEQHPHVCYDQCPVCWCLTVENFHKLAEGGSVKVGTADELIEVAQAGCEFCQTLCRIFESFTTYLKPGATIQINAQHQRNEPPSRLECICFEISESTAPMLDNRSLHYQEFHFRSWAFTFGMFKIDPDLDSFVSRFPPSQDVSSEIAFRTAKSWISNCVANHNDCRRSNSKLPTRVLRIAPDDPGRVYLYATQTDEEGEYAALSYVWGGETNQVKLSAAKLSEFLGGGLETDTLPKTVQDAITTTSKLGLPYLWVDALCIIQDSENDKTKEIADMPDIFKNATVTISAAVSADSRQGFLHDRPKGPKVYARLPLILHPEQKDILGWVFLCLNSDIGYEPVKFSKEIINTRAWTYQEAWLSPRLLVYGSGPPQWHCLQDSRVLGLPARPHVQGAGQPHSSTMEFATQHGRMQKADKLVTWEESPSDKQLDGRQKFLSLSVAPPNPADSGTYVESMISLISDWFTLMGYYSQRLLTYPTDKLVALSGLASEYHRLMQDDYVAGLWRSSLPASLLWWRVNAGSASVEPSENIVKAQSGQRPKSASDPKSPLQSLFSKMKISGRQLPSSKSSGEETKSQPQSKYIAPSWSPLSMFSQISYEDPGILDRQPQTRRLVDIYAAEAELVTSIAPFGQISSAYIDLVGPMCQMDWAELTSAFVFETEGLPHVYWDYIIPDRGAAFVAEMASMSSAGKPQDQRGHPSFNPQTQIRNKVTQLPIIRNPGPEDKASEEILASLPPRPNPRPLRTSPPYLVTPNITPPDAVCFATVAQHTGPAASPNPDGSCSSSAPSNATGSTRPKPVRPHSPTDTDPDTRFWLLELSHSHTPSGLLLKRVKGNIFRRVGYFHMARQACPETLIVDGHVVSGPRTFDWDDRLELCRIFLV